MKKIFFAIAIIGAVAFGFQAEAASTLSGKLLLQVDGRGEIWYANPVDQHRYLLPSEASEAFDALSTIAVNISQAELDKIPGAADKFAGSSTIRSKYAGKWVKIGDSPEKIWYIGWKSKKKFWFDGSEPSFKYLHSLTTGAVSRDINRLSTAEFNLPKEEEPIIEEAKSIESAPGLGGTSTEILPVISDFNVTKSAVNTEIYVMVEGKQVYKPMLKVTFSKPVSEIVWHVFEVAPSNAEIWNQKYPFEIAEDQVSFSLSAGNVEKGKEYNYMIEATARGTGEQGKFYGTFKIN